MLGQRFLTRILTLFNEHLYTACHILAMFYVQIFALVATRRGATAIDSVFQTSTLGPGRPHHLHSCS